MTRVFQAVDLILLSLYTTLQRCSTHNCGAEQSLSASSLSIDSTSFCCFWLFDAAHRVASFLSGGDMEATRTWLPNLSQTCFSISPSLCLPILLGRRSVKSVLPNGELVRTTRVKSVSSTFHRYPREKN
jgi:hypothetical protein